MHRRKLDEREDDRQHQSPRGWQSASWVGDISKMVTGRRMSALKQAKNRMLLSESP